MRIRGAKHKGTPFRRCFWNNSAETFHGLVEENFYEVEDHSGRDELLARAHGHQPYFTYKRMNRWRERMSPVEILRSEKKRKIRSRVLNLSPVILDHFISEFDRGGYHVPTAVMWK